MTIDTAYCEVDFDVLDRGFWLSSSRGVEEEYEADGGRDDAEDDKQWLHGCCGLRIELAVLLDQLPVARKVA